MEAVKAKKAGNLKKGLNVSMSSVNSSRTNLFGYEVEKPISLLRLDLKDNTFRLSQSAKEYLSSLEGECYVISVSGNPLVGKSSFLNLLLSFFIYHNNDLSSDLCQNLIPYKDIYVVGDGKKSTTDGVELYCLTIKNKNYIFMDVEGDNDPNKKKTGVWIYTNLIYTALAVSHVHFYNYVGLPQESFISYFNSIHKLSKQNKFHSNFATEHIFLKKDHHTESEEELIQDKEEIQGYLNDKLSGNELNFSLHLFNPPPLHIQKKSKNDSCLKSTGFVCEECQKSSFLQIFSNLFKNLTDSLQKAPSFENGQSLVSLLERVQKINEKELPFYVDMGHISQIRMIKFQKDDARIKNGLVQIENVPIERNFSKQIQKILTDHPLIVQETDWAALFTDALKKIVIQISQMEFLLPEISKFLEESLFEEGFSILGNSEKEVLIATYVTPLKNLTKEILECFQKYEIILDGLIKKIVEIKEEIQSALKVYKSATFDVRARTMAISSGFFSSSVLASLATEVGIRVFAGCLVGGGAIGAILTVVLFIQAKKKWDKTKKKNEEIMNAKKIPGVGNVEEEIEEMTRLQEFLEQKFEELEFSRQILKGIREEEAVENNQLIVKIEEAVERILKNDRLSEEERSRLIACMKGAHSNFEKFRQCI